MNTYNVLVTGVGSCGVGEGVYKALLSLDKYNIYSCNNSESSLFLYDEPEKSFIVPQASKKEYIDILFDLCIKYKICAVIPGSEQELTVLSQNRDQFEENDIRIFANSDKIISIFNNKWETFLFLKSLGIKTPDTTQELTNNLFIKKYCFPLLIKPVVGNASRNIFIVNSNEELTHVTKYMRLKDIQFIIQQYVGSENEEYTISVLSDFSGQYLGSVVFKRKMLGGFSQFIICDGFDSIDEQAQIIASKINSKGPLNIQCRIVENEIYVFEINPRFSGTTPFRAMVGFNEVDILFEKIFHNTVSFNKKNIKVGTFGVRGFQEKIYDMRVKTFVKSYDPKEE